MYNNQFSLSTVYKLTKFTSISQVFHLLFFLLHQTPYIYINSAIAKRRSCFHPFSLSLSPTHCIAVPLCPQSRQKRFVRSPRKIPPHVYYNTRHAFLLLAPILAAFERRQMRRLEGIKLAIRRDDLIYVVGNQCFRGRWKVNG